MHKSLLVLSLAALCLYVQAMPVYVYPSLGPTESTAGFPGFHLNFFVTEVGSAVRMYSSTNNSNQLLFELNAGQTYTFRTEQPAYYHYSSDLEIIDFGRNGSYVNFPMIPVASGVSVLNLEGSSHKYQGVGAYLNVSFPHGVFDFDSASLFRMQGTLASAIFGAGVPPAQLYMGDPTTRFSTLNPGTYRLYSEARTYQYQTNPNDTNWNAITGNFTAVKGRYAIFAGDDAATGFKGAFTSANRSEANWYIGDIIVTKPSPDCYKYEWAMVNTYSVSYGAFDQTAHTVSSDLQEECFDLSNPAALECVDILFNDSTPTSTCGAFGDPHIIKFDRTGVTCGNQSYVTLIDNDYFNIGATAELVSATSEATIFKSIVFTYKLPCNPITVTFTDTAGASMSGVNAPLAYRHALRLYGNNIYIDALHLRFQARTLWGSAGLTFGLSVPSSMVSTSTGVCTDSCPGYEVSLSKKRDARFAALATAACDGIPTDTYEYESCMFDVGLTGNVDFASMATSFIATKDELATPWTVPDAPPSWPEPTPDTPMTTNPPTGTNPPTANPPTASAPTAASSVVAPSIFLLVVAIAALLF